MRRFLVLGLAGTAGGFILLVILYAVFRPELFRLPGFLARGEEYKVGERFPDFTATTVDGERFHLAEHPHKVLLVNYFTTW